MGISELFFIHPEAVRPYEGLLAANASSGDYVKGPIISSNRSAVGLEYNILFNANARYTISQSGPATFSTSALFDGRMNPNYPGGTPTPRIHRSSPFLDCLEITPKQAHG